MRTCLAAIVAGVAGLVGRRRARSTRPRSQPSGHPRRGWRGSSASTASCSGRSSWPSGKEFYLVLDPGASDLTLMLSGAELQRYPVIGLQVGQPRVSWITRRDPRPWQDVIWSHGELDPPRQIDRLVIQAAPPEQGRRRAGGSAGASDARGDVPGAVALPGAIRPRAGPSRCVRWTPTSRRDGWRASAPGGARSGTTSVAAVFRQGPRRRPVAHRAESQGRGVALSVAAARGAPDHPLAGPPDHAGGARPAPSGPAGCDADRGQVEGRLRPGVRRD